MHQGHGMRAWIGDGNLGASGGPRTIASYQYGKLNGEDVKGQVGGAPSRYVIESVSERFPAFPERLRAQLSHTTVINKRLLMCPHGPLSGVRKNFKKACPHRNLHHRISMQLRSK